MFDAHTHLQDTRLKGCREAVLRAAAAAGVSGLCTCGASPDDWNGVALLASDAASPVVIHPAFGVHPWFCGDLPPDWLERLDACLLAHPGAAVGEIGIDGLRRAADPLLQRRVFTAQLELAIQRGRTVVVHGARCWGALAELLQPCAARLPGLVLHAFSASEPLVKTFLGLGATFSLVGSLCNPNARRVHAAAAAIPLDRLLIETDTPDILPFGGDAIAEPASSPDLNQPANLPLVARALARIKGIDEAEIGALTERNARRVYGMKKLA
jgi:TatD DNase family protein